MLTTYWDLLRTLFHNSLRFIQETVIRERLDLEERRTSARQYILSNLKRPRVLWSIIQYARARIVVLLCHMRSLITRWPSREGSCMCFPFDSANTNSHLICVAACTHTQHTSSRINMLIAYSWAHAVQYLPPFGGGGRSLGMGKFRDESGAGAQSLLDLSAGNNSTFGRLPQHAQLTC